ncbi:MAG TPA: metal-sensitive transcriptional regulator [Ktedonobacterales bacterium]|jgi:CsoR family transcriptional regulator, copper-sensing transcriptional repressor|nr:metal-sensitive transcriptional regulator [Ktedonobacterales bacterium]
MPGLTERAESDIQLRLRRIEGQIRGVIGMLGDGKPCEDVVTQVLAARAALDRVAMEILRCSVEEAVNDQLSDEAREAVLRAITLMGKVQ